MGYTVGDIPAVDLVIDPVRVGPEGEASIDLTPFAVAEATLTDPTGLEVEGPGLLATISHMANTITIEWPSTTPFAVAGIYELRVIVTSVDLTVRQALPVVRLVADAESDGWYTLDTAREDWPSAPGYDPWLYDLLWVARNDVLAYAPALPEHGRPPVNYRRAQLQQARNIWNASKVDPASGGLGEDDFTIRPFPLDWAIKQTLRPRRATGALA